MSAHRTPVPLGDRLKTSLPSTAPGKDRATGCLLSLGPRAHVHFKLNTGLSSVPDSVDIAVKSQCTPPSPAISPFLH